MDNEEQKDYIRLVAAQNEAARRLRIQGIQNTLTQEHRERRNFAIISGICFIGFVAQQYFGGMDFNQDLNTQLQSLLSFDGLKNYLETYGRAQFQALASFDGLKNYLKTFTPAQWLTLFGTAGSYSNYLKHSRKYAKANQEFYDMMDNQPIDYQDVVERQARSR